MSSGDMPLSRAGKVALALLLVAILGGLSTVIYVVNHNGHDAPCPLCDAVTAQDPAAVEQVLQSSPGIDASAWRSAVEALPTGSAEAIAIARLLVMAGADPNYSWMLTGRGANPGGHWAAALVAERTDDPALVDAMVAHGLDTKGRAGAEALVAAAGHGRVAVVRRLLDAGVPANAQGGWPRRSALAEAIQTRHLPTIAALERAGAVEW